MFAGNSDATDVFNVDDDQIEQLEETDPIGEVEPEFSPTVRTLLKTCLLLAVRNNEVFAS